MNKNKKKVRYKLRMDRFLLLIVLPLAVLIGAGVFLSYWISPLRLKSEDVLVQLKEEYDSASNVKTAFLGNIEDVDITGDVDTGTEGTYSVTYTFKGHEKTANITVADTEPPKLEVKKTVMADMFQEVGAEDFVESVTDATEVTLELSGVDLDKAGSHEVTITATDAKGNVTEQQALFVREEDKAAPNVTENEAVTLLQGNDYAVENISFSDDLDPSPAITYDASTIDVTVPGTYKVAVTATDRSGNGQTVYQEVTVKENPEYGKKVVYLTFDDGPSANTEKILDILKKYGVKATFFVTGNGQAHNDMIVREDEEGHTVGIHTYSHNYAAVYASEDAYWQDLNALSDMVEQLIGKKPMVVRLPGGSSNMVSTQYSEGIMTKITAELIDAGYQYFDWNADSTDASGNNVAVDKIVANATACSADVCNILFHDTDAKDTTVEALPQIIQYYKDQGYVFLPLTAESTPVHHRINN
jgi:peptidoglycan/xylan/chitin deacetylase (PgdA/CDA1 family)